MYNNLPKRSGIYFIRDNIKNLEIQIQFRHINSLLKLPKYERLGKGLNQIQQNQYAIPEEETKIIKIQWQQKIFSPIEAALYREEQNCTTELHKNYHQILKAAEASDVAAESRKTKQRKKKRTKRNNLEVGLEDNIKDNVKQNFIFTYINDDNFQPPENLLLQSAKNMTDSAFEVMYVYADLKPYTQLVAMKWYPQDKMLHIYPDFNDFENQAYFIEIDTDYRHLYSYGLENISAKKALDKNKNIEDFLYLPELNTAHWRSDDELADKFAMPPKRTQRCCLLFEITKAYGFEYQNIHIRYNIRLPANTILEEGLFNASSHSSSHDGTSFREYHMDLIWQITVLCEELFDPAQLLHIFFEVISIDEWQRERVEGYSHYAVNLLKPFSCQQKLQYIRPRDTWWQAINRYFIGGRYKFDYEQFFVPISVAESASDQFHCRYGLCMQSSGHLEFCCQLITQRNCELLNPCTSRSSGMTLDDIMLAYREARRRLESLAVK